ncbi:MAG TPA: oxidoreductase [Cryomorphaceae bacterium]|nr:oxidoreductase [Cryomorphaceae bacterium]
MSKKWNLPNNKDLNSKIAIVTGANTGLGFETAKAFAELGATVILACRNTEKGNKAKDKIIEQVPKASLEVSELDLADFESIRKFSDRFNSNQKKLDFLVNNAGVMMPPYHETEEGHELQWGVNHLGHFLLTSLLWKKLNEAEAARVVQLSSLAHKWGNISAFNKPIGKSNYDKQKAYGNSKLACLVFALELERRIESKGLKIKSMAAHPGVADTELSRYLPGWMKVLSPLFMAFVANSAEEGAQPSLRAALDDLPGGTYVGPSGFKEMKGSPVVVQPHEKATSQKAGKELWQASEEQIGISFAV